MASSESQPVDHLRSPPPAPAAAAAAPAGGGPWARAGRRAHPAPGRRSGWSGAGCRCRAALIITADDSNHWHSIDSVQSDRLPPSRGQPGTEPGTGRPGSSATVCGHHRRDFWLAVVSRAGGPARGPVGRPGARWAESTAVTAAAAASDRHPSLSSSRPGFNLKFK
jgi:hypothetical protein